MKASKIKENKESYLFKVKYNKNGIQQVAEFTSSKFDVKEINSCFEKYKIDTSLISSEKEPSLIINNNIFCWYKNGKIHRIDGPAVKVGNFDSFVLKGIITNKKDFAVKTNHQLCKNCNEFCKQKCFFDKTFLEDTQLEFNSFFNDDLKKEMENLSPEDLLNLKTKLESIWNNKENA